MHAQLDVCSNVATKIDLSSKSLAALQLRGRTVLDRIDSRLAGSLYASTQRSRISQTWAEPRAFDNASPVPQRQPVYSIGSNSEPLIVGKAQVRPAYRNVPRFGSILYG